MRPSVLVKAAPSERINTISTKFVSGVGFSNGWAEFTLKKPPPSPLSSLIASCVATGPSAMSCVPPVMVFASMYCAKVCGTPCATKNTAAATQIGSST
jgi:hypothetical protein